MRRIGVVLCLFIGVLWIPDYMNIRRTSRTFAEEDQENSTAEDLGDFKVIYSPTQNPKYLEVEKYFKESKLFEEVASELNKILILPRDIPIIFKECGEKNAFYNSNNNQMIMCYELIEGLAESFSTIVKSEDELEKATINTTFFVFFHELGHALIQNLKLPTTGNAEDNADQLAFIILAAKGDEGEEAILHSGTWFLAEGALKEVDDLPFWDEHPLDMQRFYNIFCWLYGTNPQKYDELVKKGLLPEKRAIRCEGEYNKMDSSWEQLLAPHIKQEQQHVSDEDKKQEGLSVEEVIQKNRVAQQEIGIQPIKEKTPEKMEPSTDYKVNKKKEPSEKMNSILDLEESYKVTQEEKIEDEETKAEEPKLEEIESNFEHPEISNEEVKPEEEETESLTDYKVEEKESDIAGKESAPEEEHHDISLDKVNHTADVEESIEENRVVYDETEINPLPQEQPSMDTEDVIQENEPIQKELQINPLSEETQETLTEEE